MPIGDLHKLYLEIILFRNNSAITFGFPCPFPMLPYFFMAELTSESYRLKSKAAYFPC